MVSRTLIQGKIIFRIKQLKVEIKRCEACMVRDSKKRKVAKIDLMKLDKRLKVIKKFKDTDKTFTTVVATGFLK